MSKKLSKDDQLLYDKLNDTESAAGAFAVLYAEAPPAIKNYLDGRIMEILMVDLPKLHILMEAGPTVERGEMLGVEQAYVGGLEHAKEKHPESYKLLTATVKDCGIELARLLDKCAARVLLDDKVANRHASINMSAEHAKILRCLTDLPITPEQAVKIEDWDNDPN